MKKAFPRGHIEPARDPVALGKYVTKEATKVAELPTGQSAYPSLSKLWELIYLYYNTEENDGWDCLSLENGHVRFYNDELDEKFTNTPLVVFDNAVRSLIVAGYHVESLCANPSTRSMWKLYARELIARSHKLATAKPDEALETEDRQTDSVDSVQEVVVPTTITNACPQEQQVGSPRLPSWGPPPP